MSETQILAFILVSLVAIASWLDAVLARRKCDDLQRQNKEMRWQIDECVSNCEEGRRQRDARREEVWKWN